MQEARPQNFDPRSERSRRLLDQMELQLEELTASAVKDEKVGVALRSVRRDSFRIPVRRSMHPTFHCKA
jgi:hypothetical protein